MERNKIIQILLAIGILVSIYLTISRYDLAVLACPSTGIVNCESVITSQYSEFFGIPTSILAIILFALGFYMLFKDETMKFLWQIAGAGAVLYSFGAQFLLGEVCIYCLTLDLIIIALIVIANGKR